MPLAILFGIFAALGLLLAFIGHARRSSSVAPSMYRNDLSPKGYAVFVICGLIALASFAAFAKPDAPCPPFDQCTPKGAWNAPNCKCWDKR
jgi:hypothetical protein